MIVGDELRQKCETERNEIERLHQEIAELQQIRDDLYEEEDSSASSDESQDEEELQTILNKLIKDNQDLVVSVCQCVCMCLCVCDNVQQIHHKKATFLGIDSSSDLMENHIRRFSVRLLANISGHKFDCNIKYPNPPPPRRFFFIISSYLFVQPLIPMFLSTQGFEGGGGGSIPSLVCFCLHSMDSPDSPLSATPANL